MAQPFPRGTPHNMVMHAFLLALALGTSGAAFGQQAWPPTLPVLRLSGVAGAPRGTPLDANVVCPGLSLIAENNPRGLGEEASRLEQWRQGKQDLRLSRHGEAWVLSDAEGGTVRLSPAMGESLAHMNEYFGMTAESAARPPTHEELKAALLSGNGVAQIRAIFEESLRRRFVVGQKVLIPEMTGEATISEQGLTFHRAPDLMLPILRSLDELRSDPEGLRRLYRREDQKMKLLDPQGQFREFLFEKLPAWEAKDFPAADKRQNILHMHIDGILEVAALTSYGIMQATLEGMGSQDWSGRLVGIWHTHPPVYTASALEGMGDFWGGPSGADKEAALKSGQNLTIAFYPDGFNAYDLSELKGPDTDEGIRVITYRSASWREHFQRLHSTLLKRP